MAISFEQVKAEVAWLRENGRVCADAWLSADGKTAGYTLDPDDDTGYKAEYDLETGDFYHCGNGQGCFWVCDRAETEEEDSSENILDYIDELIAEGYSEEEAYLFADVAFGITE